MAEKTLMRIFITDDDKLAVSCTTEGEEDFLRLSMGLASLFVKTPQLIYGVDSAMTTLTKQPELVYINHNNKITS